MIPTIEEISKEAGSYAERFSDDLHGISEVSFIAGAEYVHQHLFKQCTVSGALLAEMQHIRLLALQKQENHKKQGLSESYIEATACIGVIDHLLKFIQQ